MALGPLLVVPLTVAVAAFGACGGSSAESAASPAAAVPARAPQVLTARHHLRTFRLERGREIELRLASGDRVEASGGSVTMGPIDFFVDPGYVAWQLRAAAPGRTQVAGRAGGRRFRVTLVVPG